MEEVKKDKRRVEMKETARAREERTEGGKSDRQSATSLRSGVPDSAKGRVKYSGKRKREKDRW